MKGIVFTEFLELVEDKFGLEMVDKIISSSELESEGVYTSVGTYSFSEMLQLLQHLSENTGISIDNLLLVYAEHFFGVIEKSYPGLLATYKDPIEMISSIENHIHVEVRKIYPDAELPTFEVIEKTDKYLIMDYTSSRAMHHFGLGLMNKTFEHFNSTATIELEKIKEDGTKVRFVINKN
ncbi:heme NO-binding domain-containing protein [Winogradskyella echinorum]|uniref:Heme NO-binding domain-containing protein n=1 Tax=Winogradskyella echinorum TaxID=538189 RepID=A0ABR6XYA2_9FLAO|nr:heme NO-binding domain-containing protein [Winogradskyella echinorum]MBC3845384.1 heme NO-binding domain-containing protein [Winogradskyella echinorum]MBC5749732.1 heme NO-binding domain-containing protein [Winogradskyella echinorum]